MAQCWEPIELTLDCTETLPAEPYVGVDCWCDWIGPEGQLLRRPAFWDGGSTWRVRFAAPSPGRWRWRCSAQPGLAGLDGVAGSVEVAPAGGDCRWQRHGLLRMGPEGRCVRHDDGRPWLLVADTAWALPWRALPEEVERYAALRRRQGFTAVLLMSVMPDQRRPRERRRDAIECWDEGFADLPEGRHARLLLPEYFQRLDQLVRILHAHDLVPVWNPFFHGYGYRGSPVAGCTVADADVARYTRYLVARYGAGPALWLVGADGSGRESSIPVAGRTVEAWDCYQQPTGIHYGPQASPDAHQDAPWLDFQWCQTGHNGEHLPERLVRMWERRPIRAVANGESTYERIGDAARATGIWQGHEAWRNLCAGGTMGVVYGAGSLWQWRRSDQEEDQPWAMAAGCSWEDALGFDGASWVGSLGRILDGIDLARCQPDHGATYGRPALLAADERFICYLHQGGDLQIIDRRVPRAWRALAARDGREVARGRLGEQPRELLRLPAGEPLVLLCEA